MKVFKDKYSKYLYYMENEDRENNVEKVSANIFKNTRSHQEYQYLSLLENILENGTW